MNKRMKLLFQVTDLRKESFFSAQRKLIFLLASSEYSLLPIQCAMDNVAPS